MHLTKRHYLIIGAVLLAAALTLSAATLRDGSDPVTLPEHTAIRVTLDQALASNQSRPGSHGLRAGHRGRQDGDPSGRPR
jgi:hypothetical protein